MEMEFSYKIRGLDEAIKLFDKLPEAFQGKVAVDAVRAGAQVYLKDLKRRTQHLGEGKLARSVRAFHKPSKNKHETVFVVKVRSPIAHLLEFGTAPHKIVAGSRKHYPEGFVATPGMGRKGLRAAMNVRRKVLADKAKGVIFGTVINHPGVSPRPFMRPAFDENYPKVFKIINEHFVTALARHSEKYAGTYVARRGRR